MLNFITCLTPFALLNMQIIIVLNYFYFPFVTQIGRMEGFFRVRVSTLERR